MRVKPLLLMMGLAMATTANANWLTKIDDDIFSDQKVGLLIGEIGPSHALAFDCSEGKLSAALLEEGEAPAQSSLLKAELLIKVDQNPPIKMRAVYANRNAKFNQVISYDRDLTLKVLKQIQAAQSKILVGTSFPEIDSKWSASASVAGSTRETTRFMEACKLN
ncbi:hypothetical protein [Stutzerimonas kunmingensis]|uniref:hypothetical protein n=1 Tax=Stutzerimonas kunmingensis TaxID=1211807 RepID=UPI001F2D5EDC|nr:hypothetical protein [Stutzerimonas kunmingensis]UIP34460.1 hypothetical protein LW136_08505 [Stutzerimonas kunmingensis]